MPTPAIIAVFVSSTNWIKFKYADQSVSPPGLLTTAAEFFEMADEMSSAVWLELQVAIKHRDMWITVPSSEPKEK